jgi:hypothetical protein
VSLLLGIRLSSVVAPRLLPVFLLLVLDTEDEVAALPSYSERRDCFSPPGAVVLYIYKGAPLRGASVPTKYAEHSVAGCCCLFRQSLLRWNAPNEVACQLLTWVKYFVPPWTHAKLQGYFVRNTKNEVRRSLSKLDKVVLRSKDNIKGEYGIQYSVGQRDKDVRS